MVVESKSSDRLWLSFSLALAKPNNSPTIYYMAASLLIQMAEKDADFDALLKIMQLDGNCSMDRQDNRHSSFFMKA